METYQIEIQLQQIPDLPVLMIHLHPIQIAQMAEKNQESLNGFQVKMMTPRMKKRKKK